MGKGEPVLLMPTYKSFTDQFVMLYSLLAFNMPIPFTMGNLEDTPRVSLVDSLLRNIGYILSARSRD
mgnify:FL=1